ncbi:MAG: zf-TFIIB domain-containing protein [Pseudomonadota bacterium]|jgi:Zn-finger nucleic acid-binding protein|nr:zf-TFIIB domain-containing protein [Pseudomonadota bacterium]HON39478.1 zf-TFIIB domain-containing protein [Deltaproteobacteria bacterium]HPD22560.1 zf-TFIIB domain-containing protein [Deltaproteobacteria bacterium]
MNCPQCEGILVTLEFDRIEIDHCPGCKGVWLDSGELRMLLDREGGDFLPVALSVAQGKEKKRTCPICSKGMKKVLVGGNRILIDECPGHGMWFDHGELTGVLKEACANNRGQDLAESLVRLLDEVFVPGSGE